MTERQPGTYLECDVCGKRVGPVHSYEEWSDTALRLGWDIGEDLLMCDTCSPMPTCGVCGMPATPELGYLVWRVGVLRHAKGCEGADRG